MPKQNGAVNDSVKLGRNEAHEFPLGVRVRVAQPGAPPTLIVAWPSNIDVIPNAGGRIKNGLASITPSGVFLTVHDQGCPKYGLQVIGSPGVERVCFTTKMVV
ncbi:MAG: hypothetical protein HYT48_00025 [Candidatus Vogelbacteria bacterium]|nr:hypothetical protein [Candidatus Vogelbacteria bacterium]